MFFRACKKKPYSEDDITGPLNVYGKSKLSGEVKIHSICSHAITLRTSWVFSEFGNNFVKTMLKIGRERDELCVVSDQFGDPTYAGDIARALISIAHQYYTKPETCQYGVFHYSGFPYVSWYEFAQSIFKQAGQQGLIAQAPILKPIDSELYAVVAQRPKNSKLNSDLIMKYYSLEVSDWYSALSKLKGYDNFRVSG